MKNLHLTNFVAFSEYMNFKVKSTELMFKWFRLETSKPTTNLTKKGMHFSATSVTFLWNEVEFVKE